MGLQTLALFANECLILSHFGCFSGHVLSKTKSVTPHFFYISDITNSSSYSGKSFRKKSMLENFRANVLKCPIIVKKGRQHFYSCISKKNFAERKNEKFATAQVNVLNNQLKSQSRISHKYFRALDMEGFLKLKKSLQKN